MRSCLRLIDDERNDVFMLIDKKTCLSKHQIESIIACCSKSHIFVDNSIIVNWGGYSQINAVLYLLKTSMNTGRTYDYYHYMQGSDLPIKNQDQIHSFFDENQGKEFISVERKRSAMAYSKCVYYHFFCHNRFFRRNKLVKALNFSLVYFQKFVGVKHNTDIDLYQGSALFSVTNNFVRYLLSREKEIYKRFRYACAADECFMQTIAMDSHFRDKIVDIQEETSCNARLIDRTRPDGKNSPHTWRISDIESIINQPQGVCFARKFDEKIYLDVVKIIEEYLLHNGRDSVSSPNVQHLVKI